MKKATLSLLLTLVACCAASSVDPNLKRASALVTTHVHNAEEARTASLAPPVVRHDKVAGNGYKPGSPLYAKQEALKAYKKDGGEVQAPPSDDKKWDELSSEEKDGARKLGYDKQKWDWKKKLGRQANSRTSPSKGKKWEELDQAEQEGAAALGWNPASWNEGKSGGTSIAAAWKRLGKAWPLEGFYKVGNFLYVVIAEVLGLLIVCLFAFLYRKYYTRPPVQQLNATDGKFQTFLFDVSCAPGDMVICCMSCFCEPIRWSETVSHSNMTGYGMSFWPALLTTLVLWSLFYFTGGLSGLVVLALQVYYRQQLRKAYDYERSAKILCVDCLTWCWCHCCAAVQEAREVEKVRSKAAQARDGQVLPGEEVGARKQDAPLSRLQANRLVGPAGGTRFGGRA